MNRRILLDDAKLQSIGLQGPCRLERLDRVVILAGPNGGGKTRLLKALCNESMDAGRLFGRRDLLERQASMLERGHRELIRDFQREELETARRFAQTVDLSSPPTSVLLLETAEVELGNSFVADPREQAGVMGKLASSRGNRLTKAAKGMAIALAAPGHVDAQLTGERAQQLSNAVQARLGTRIWFEPKDEDPIPTLFERPYDPKELSCGQHLLLTWALLLHDQELVKPGGILFIDEPERQLHPDVAIQNLVQLEERLGEEGQLWIATHSPAIVAHYGRKSVYWVAENKITYSGSRMHTVMDGLVGGSNARRDFADFLHDIDQLCLVRYAAEALERAMVAEHRDGDAQEVQFLGRVREALADSGRKLRILDYAAGKGRFARALAESLNAESKSRIEYFASYSPPFDSDNPECVDAISGLHSDNPRERLVDDLSQFTGENAVDIVVMSNFLHELAPTDWQMHFANAAHVLAAHGMLVVMEDQEPPVGELPTHNGAIVLDIEGLRVMFGGDDRVRSVSRGAERLMMAEVPRNVLSSWDPTNLRRALELTAERAKSAVLRLRDESGPSTPSRARRHAFYALLFANAQLWLDEQNRRDSCSENPGNAAPAG